MSNGVETLRTTAELLTDQFYRWELLGRGWIVRLGPVDLEPPFRPFIGHSIPRSAIQDDGQIESGLGRLANSFLGLLGKKEEPMPVATPEELDEPEPEFIEGREELVELQTFLPADLSVKREEFEQFLFGLSLCRGPVTFELIGLPPHVTAQFVVEPADESLVRQQLQAFFPDAVFLPERGTLKAVWSESPDDEALIVEFGLGREFMLPLASGKIDPFIGIVGALSEIGTKEVGLFQVMFQPVRHPWAESILRAVTDGEGNPFFTNAPEILEQAKDKVARPLYAAIVRIAAKSPDWARSREIARNLASALGVFASPTGNELIPLANDDYPLSDHEDDLVRRESRRSGMLLNSEELIGFVHLPSEAVRSEKLRRQTHKSKAAPKAVADSHGLLLGQNIHAGRSVPVALTSEQRVRHMHVIGASGTGKSTLLFNLICQDIERGQGVGVLDPHGDLVDRILEVIPPERIDDVVLIDPSDEEYSVGFNILSAHSDLEKNLLASDLVSVFQRLSTSWGDQMASVLNNAILAFLESDRGGTLADLRRFLLEPDFRGEFLQTVRDPDIVYYWRKGFVQLSGNKSIGPVITRLETFLSRKPIRYMVSQAKNRLDFANILDTGKIFLAKLAQGTIGRENSYLLGTLFVAKLQQLAMSRQRQAEGSRRDFWLYIDEAPNFMTPTMGEILAGARKYRLGLILAHQELRQLQRDPEVASAVLSNPFTRVCFRVGDDDARKLENGFSFFEAQDLQNLSTGEAICRVERSDFDFNLSVSMREKPDEAEAAERRSQVIAASRAKYGTPRKEIEATLYIRQEPGPTEKEAKPEAKKEAKRKGAPVEVPMEQTARPAPPIPPLPAREEVPQSSPHAAVPPSKPLPESRLPAPPADIGRGGAQHQAIQLRLKAVAEGLGFRATIEKQILDGQGSIDLVLERPPAVMACEISVTTTIDHEVGNVRKCLKAGFGAVAVLSPSEDRLRKIEAAVRNSLGPDVAGNVAFFLPDDFIHHLQTLIIPPAKPTPAPEEQKHGYRVKRNFVKLSPEEAKARQDAALKLLADKAKRKRKSK